MGPRFCAASVRYAIALLGRETGALALLLTTVGLYGLLALVTNQRTREIGIRMVLGVLGGLAASRYLASRLHGIDSPDPVSFALGAGIGIGAGLVGGLVPALRAARLDPAITMRSE